MTVLVTGALGNTALYVIKKLIEEGYEVIGIDQRNSQRRTRLARIKKMLRHKRSNFKFYFLGLGDKAAVQNVVTQYPFESVVHLAFVIPPYTEINPEASYRANVIATRNLVEIVKELIPQAFFLFTSSTTVYGPHRNSDGLIKEDHPTVATSHYTQQKLECENLIKDSGLNWCICRCSAIMNPLFRPDKITIDFGASISRDTPLEPVHVEDVASAIFHALKQRCTYKTFIISGGEKNRLIFRDYIIQSLEGMVGKVDPNDIPWDKLFNKPYYLNWYDSSYSQAILNYQQHSVEDYKREAYKSLSGGERLMILLFKRLIIKYYLFRVKDYNHIR